MKSVLAVSFLASLALASPMMERAKLELQARNAARRGNTFKAAREGSTNLTATTTESTNWSGAAIVTTGVTEVSGTFTVPVPSAPSGGKSNTEYCGAAWVGIDGYNNAALIQTGVLWCVEGSSYEYEAWYEYLPASLIYYSGFSVSAGSSVTVTATKTSTTGGTTTISAGGKSASHTFSGQSTKLQGASAEWIVEDFTSGSSLVPFANFGTVTFTGATAVINGATVSASADSPVNIELESSTGSILTSTTISGSTVTVKYV
ncbi:peptidase A4 family-domain-containing protein [Hypoxylon argillaceum]|nr:peptidase A4 family-domain-containing protein [Hypoxylon argillaceum]KAI1151879.1 peptidase A4 family-domain-containing protein [Nemania diffusa]